MVHLGQVMQQGPGLIGREAAIAGYLIQVYGVAAVCGLRRVTCFPGDAAFRRSGVRIPLITCVDSNTCTIEV